MLSKRIPSGLLLLCLTMFGAGCTTVPLTPPAELLADCPEPAAPTERTNAGLAQSVAEYQHALALCNTDKAALRAWSKGEP